MNQTNTNQTNTNEAKKKDNRRYKYGSVSVAFTAVFIALIIIVNVFFSALSLSGDLTVDLTAESFTDVGDDSIALLTALGEDLDVTIYFMAARDVFDAEANAYNGINLTGICRDLAENYANIFNGKDGKGTIRVEYKELDTDPEFERKYLENAVTKLSSTSVIVQGKHHYRVLDLFAFFNNGEDGTSFAEFNGEYQLTTAILKSSISEAQVATFTYGNGEPVGKDEEGNIIGSASALADMLLDAGFEVAVADLDYEPIPENTRMILCYDPAKDLTDHELDKIGDYLGNRNSFTVFVDFETAELPKLQDFLSTNWGINYKSGYRLTDDTKSLSNKVENILAKAPAVSNDTEGDSAAYNIRKAIGELSNNVNSVFPNSVELVIEEKPSQANYIVETVLSSYDTAVSTKGEEKGAKGEKPLMLLSTKYGFNKDNVKEYSYVMLVGSTEFANSSNLSGGNELVFRAAARIFSDNQLAPDIAAKAFSDSALTIETGTASKLTIVICTVLPAVVIILGIAVFLKRRHL